MPLVRVKTSEIGRRGKLGGACKDVYGAMIIVACAPHGAAELAKVQHIPQPPLLVWYQNISGKCSNQVREVP